MSVGFKLKPNTYSRMSHLPAPYIINEAGVPVPGAPDFVQQVQLRYGTPLPDWQPFDSAPGLHEPEFEYFLANIAIKDPSWFENNGFGKATGGTVADFIEAHDAWYGKGAYEAVSEKSADLDKVDPAPPPVPPPPQTCKATLKALCLQQSRFSVTVDWKDHQGTVGAGQAVTLTTDSGYFWFFASTNVELVVKVLDGRTLNNHYWVFYGALSDVEYNITVTDVQTGAIKVYHNPSGTMASVGDTSAFPA